MEEVEEGDTREEGEEAAATKEEEGAGVDTRHFLFLKKEELNLYHSSSFCFALGGCRRALISYLPSHSFR